MTDSPVNNNAFHLSVSKCVWP